ncbi:MAG TPA: methanol/ethanol family PQQ-dependent dehydrogenase [Thermoanaerobaculia bacterium]|nr:methanol/ethanol family PQQ-dependent dehydrogenase [Thermoanaerobaculia bacterium]
MRRHERESITVLLASILALTSCRREAPPQATPYHVRYSAASSVAAVSAADDGQWTMPTKDYANTRFSALDQINTKNVASLKLAWSFSTGVAKGHEGAPLVVGSTMYIVSPFPHRVYALDLAQPNAPVKWAYKPAVLLSAQGVACCDLVNRGAVYAAGKIIFNTLDNQTIAIDANTGGEVWKVRLGDINQGESITMAPLVVKDKVLVGNAGGEFGVRGWLQALDLATGKTAWKAYATGPDTDVLIGPAFKPFYPMDRGKDLGVKTWPPEAWRQGGGTAWGWVSYDPALDLVYYGTGNPGPWNHELRPGDNKWSASLFARDANTGQARWAYQFQPHDVWDYDAVNESTLLDVPINGQTRRVLVRAERNGYVYVMDRVTGEVLSADPYAHITTTKGIDLKSGRPIEIDAKKPRTDEVVRDICPAVPGAKDWQPSSYSPRTGLLYLPTENLCMDAEGVEANYIAGTPYLGMNVRFYAGPGGHRGELMAWDVVHRKKVWGVRERFPAYSGTVATAGDLVFYGTMDGWFKALDAHSGETLWKFKTDSGIISQPITYRGPDGKQYVAITSGVGGWPGAIVSNELDPRDANAGDGFVNAMWDLPKYSGKGSTVYAFALP